MDRRTRIRALIDERFEGNEAAFGRAVGKAPSVIWQLVSGHRNLGEKLAREFETKLALGRGYFDGRDADDQPRVPVVGTVQAGDLGYWEELQYPVGHGDGFVLYPSRDPNAYALRVKGDSMRPRIKPGEFILIEPNTPVIPGEEVLVTTKDGRSMVKVLGPRRDGMVELQSINEDHRPITVEQTDIRSMHFIGAIVKASRYYRDG